MTISHLTWPRIARKPALDKPKDAICVGIIRRFRKYLAMVEGYAAYYKLKIDGEELRKRALAWAMGRGNRSGRVAWQFIQETAGELGQTF